VLRGGRSYDILLIQVLTGDIAMIYCWYKC